MFYYFLLISVCVLLVYFNYHINYIYNYYIQILFHNCKSYYNNRIKKIRNTLSMCSLCLSLFYNTLMILIMQTLNKFNIKHFQDNIYTVEFVIGGKI